MTPLTRRHLMQRAALASGALALGPAFWSRAVASAATVTDGPYGPLGPPDANGLQLPQGFQSKLIARGNEVVPGTSYRLPLFPDGQATFATDDGGFILVTNSEAVPPDGGVSAFRFDAQGEVVDAYRILTGSLLNCGGGPTPWGTWLTGEEFDEGGGSPGGPQIPLPSTTGRGAVWECDPTQASQGVRRPKLGLFKHEAVAVDPVGQRLYLTEDTGDSGFYRFTPEVYPVLDAGVLEIALVGAGGVVAWQPVPNPEATPPQPPPRFQVADYTRFERGEGMWFDSGTVFVATTGDGKIHAYDTVTGRLSVVYDEKTVADAPLTDVDNITVSPSGDLYAAEDNGMPDGIDVAILTPDLTISRFMKATGEKHTTESEPFGVSELTGPVFDPSGMRFFVTSQRARVDGGSQPVGEVYMVTGPFRLERPSTGFVAPGVTVEEGQAVGSGQALAPGARVVGAALGVEVPRRVALSEARRRGLPVALTLDRPATVEVAVDARFRPPTRRRRRAAPRRRRGLGTARRTFAASGPQLVRARFTKASLALLRGRRQSLRVAVRVTITDAQGRRDSVERASVLTVRRPGR